MRLGETSTTEARRHGVTDRQPAPLPSPDVTDVEGIAFRSRSVASKPGRASTCDSFQAQLAVVLLGNPVALTGGFFKFVAVHDPHCSTGVLDDLLLLQDTSCQAHAGPVCPQHGCKKIMGDGQRPGIHSVL